ncbi:MAG: hypothetical protein ACOX9R_08335 [Armatimonadota bacterium]|jgi:hypothetical protein
MLEIISDQPYTVLNYDYGPHDLVTWRWHVPPDDALQTAQEVEQWRAQSMALVEEVRESVQIIGAEDRELVGDLLNEIADSVQEHWLAGIVACRLVPREVAGRLIRVTLDGGLEVNVSQQKGVQIVWTPKSV